MNPLPRIPRTGLGVGGGAGGQEVDLKRERAVETEHFNIRGWKEAGRGAATCC